MEDIRQGIRGSESFTDHVTLSLDAEAFTMHSRNTDRPDLPLAEGRLSKLEVKEPVKSMYPLDFFSAMVKAITAEEATLHIGNEYPLKIEFSMGTGRGEGRLFGGDRLDHGREGGTCSSAGSFTSSLLSASFGKRRSSRSVSPSECIVKACASRLRRHSGGPAAPDPLAEVLHLDRHARRRVRALWVGENQPDRPRPSGG